MSDWVCVGMSFSFLLMGFGLFGESFSCAFRTWCKKLWPDFQDFGGEILLRRQHEITSTGLPVSSLEKECWDWAQTSKPRCTMKILTPQGHHKHPPLVLWIFIQRSRHSLVVTTATLATDLLQSATSSSIVRPPPAAHVHGYCTPARSSRPTNACAHDHGPRLIALSLICIRQRLSAASSPVSSSVCL